MFAILGAVFSKTFFKIQTNVPEIIDYGNDYLTICLVFSFGIFFQVILEKLLQSTGKTIYSMITQSLGAITNIILDPILIFGYFGFPKMGIKGAAIATVIGQILAAVLALYFNLRKNNEIHISLRKFRPDLNIIKRIYSIGVPSIIMASIGSVMTFGMNKILIAFSTTATAVFGVSFKLQSFVFMPVFGLNNGMVPIIAFNYGARKPDRMLKTLKLSIIYAISIMIIGFIIFQLFPNSLIMLFKPSPEMLDIGATALRIISVHFIIAGFSIISSSLFQALSHGMLSLIISLIRQLIILLPVSFLFSLTGQLNLIWWAFPIAETVAGILCFIFLRYIYKKEIKALTIENV